MNSAVQLYDKDGNAVYPRPYYRIGDFLESTNPNNPGNDGYIGTWELYGKGKVTVCIDPDDTDFNTIGKTGGEKKHTLTRNELPNESLDIYDATYLPRKVPVASYGKAVGADYPGVILTSNEKADAGLYIVTEELGDGQAHNNMPPYIVIYRWRRIA